MRHRVYFATSHYQADGGIMVTASHNPKGYNGMKLVRERSRPISGDTGLNDIRQRVEAGDLGTQAATPGNVREAFDKTAYIDHLLTYVDLAALKPLKVLADPGNGAVGPVLELLKARLPLDITIINGEPDGNFPNGIPNPLLPENRDLTRQAVLDTGADMGIAFDGDFDRCFFFDNQGRFIEGYYVVGLLAEMLLAKHPGSKIIHDPRLTWNTIEQVSAAGAGHPEQDRARLHQGAYARRRCGVRWRNECPSLLPRLLLLRQRQYPVAAGGRADEHDRQEPGAAGGRADRCVPVQW